MFNMKRQSIYLGFASVSTMTQLTNSAYLTFINCNGKSDVEFIPGITIWVLR